MSGGYFNYSEYGLVTILEDLEEYSENDFKYTCDGVEYDRLEGCGDKREEVKNKILNIMDNLRSSYNDLKRLDNFLSGDHGVDKFLKDK